MARKLWLTAGVAAVILGTVAATPTVAGEPRIDVQDDPHDVDVSPPHVSPEDDPSVTLTGAERRSIELKWFKATPYSDGTVRFKVKIAEVRRTTRFDQSIEIRIEPVSPPTGDDWTYALYLLDSAPKARAWASVYTGVVTELAFCGPLPVRMNRTADTVSVGIPNECVPVGQIKGKVSIDTLIDVPGILATVLGSSDRVKFRGDIR